MGQELLKSESYECGIYVRYLCAVPFSFFFPFFFVFCFACGGFFSLFFFFRFVDFKRLNLFMTHMILRINVV